MNYTFVEELLYIEYLENNRNDNFNNPLLGKYVKIILFRYQILLCLVSPEYDTENYYYYLTNLGIQNRKNYFNDLNDKLFLER